jgi:hypothetical protein
MRSTIVAQFLAEREARPDVTYSKLRDLAILSARKLLADDSELVKVNCPACNSLSSERAFDRVEFQYWECTTCGTLYISPRPTSKSMAWYLLNSPLAEFRNSQVSDKQIREYTNELVRDRADWVVSLSQWSGMDSSAPVILFQVRQRALATLVGQNIPSTTIAVMPLWGDGPGEASSTAGVDIAESLQDLAGTGAALIMAFDCLEHLVDVDAFFTAAWNSLEPGGLLALTTRAGSGFDIQALWERLDTVFPLEHVNLLSVDGMGVLAERHDFEIIELSTPGQLDVQVVARVLASQQEWEPRDRILRRLVLETGEDGMEDLQRFLQKHLRSSHMRVVARKKRDGHGS